MLSLCGAFLDPDRFTKCSFSSLWISTGSALFNSALSPSCCPKPPGPVHMSLRGSLPPFLLPSGSVDIFPSACTTLVRLCPTPGSRHQLLARNHITFVSVFPHWAWVLARSCCSVDVCWRVKNVQVPSVGLTGAKHCAEGSMRMSHPLFTLLWGCLLSHKEETYAEVK